MFAGISLVITNLAIQEQERGKQVIVIFVVVKPIGLDLLANLFESELLATDADTNVRNMETDLHALLD